MMDCYLPDIDSYRPWPALLCRCTPGCNVGTCIVLDTVPSCLPLCCIGPDPSGRKPVHVGMLHGCMDRLSGGGHVRMQ